MHSMRSHSCLKAILGWRYTCYRILEDIWGKLRLNVLISIDLPISVLSKFGNLNHYSIMESVKYFRQVVLKRLENNELKSNFENSEMKILFLFLKISERRNLTLQNQNAHIWKTCKTRETNELILKFFL